MKIILIKWFINLSLGFSYMCDKNKKENYEEERDRGDGDARVM